MKARFLAIASGFVLTALCTPAAPTLTVLPEWFSVHAVSDDGQIVMGSYLGSWVRWTQDAGFLKYDGTNVSLYGMSANGQVTVGPRWRVADDGSTFGVPAYLEGNSLEVHALGQTRAQVLPTAVSDNGGTIIGQSFSGDTRTAVRWQRIGNVYKTTWIGDGGVHLLLSADGFTMVGVQAAQDNPSQYQVFRTDGARTDVIAEGWMGGLQVSGNGQVVFGSRGPDLYRWSASSGWQYLDWPYPYSSIGDVNFDASRVLVGNSDVWDAAYGFLTFEQLLGLSGIKLNGWQIEHVRTMNSNGTTFVALGKDPDGLQHFFVVTGIEHTSVPEPGTYAFGALATLLMTLAGRQLRRRAAHVRELARER